MPDRRPLHFDRLDDVPPEVDRLLIGHEAVGRWTLAQICTHLAAALRLTAEVPRGAAVADLPPAVERARAIARRRFFGSGRFPDGVEMPTPAIDPSPAGADPLAAADALRNAIARFLDAPGPFPAHPLLGPLDFEQWRDFHRIHCAHHLSFVLPGSTTG